jgi:dTDP-4-amino-4,6-dideoxygalactose transaminase
MNARAAIPLFRPRVADAARRALSKTIDSGWIGYGPQCRALERRFCERGGFALATSSCTSALYLAGRIVRALHGPESEIVVPSLTFVASAMAFAEAGVRPVLAEVDARTLLLDASGARRALTERTRALLAVHLYGQPAASEALRELADAHGLLLFEDCAHRIDLLDAGAPHGDFTCYSFNAVKEVPCGEGGLLWGRDPAHESLARSMSNLGLASDTPQRAATLKHGDYAYSHESGLKLRASDIEAALALGALPSLAAERAERREMFGRYDALLDGVPSIERIERGPDDARLMYVVKVDAAVRDAVRDAMAAAGIATSVHYPSLASHPLLGSPLPRAGCSDEDSRLITLPTFLDLRPADQSRVVAALIDAVASADRSRERTEGAKLSSAARAPRAASP